MQIKNFSVDEFNDEIRRLMFDYIHSGNYEYYERAMKMIADLEKENKKRQLPTDESE